MVKSMALSNRTKNYVSPEVNPLSKYTPVPTPPNGPLTLEKPSTKAAFVPPKGVLHRMTHNPNA
jgi:hypothetical protein